MQPYIVLGSGIKSLHLATLQSDVLLRTDPKGERSVATKKPYESQLCGG